MTVAFQTGIYSWQEHMCYTERMMLDFAVHCEFIAYSDGSAICFSPEPILDIKKWIETCLRATD